MPFHSWTFFLFFAAVYLLFLMCGTPHLRRVVILISSFVFYGWWNPLYLLIISWVILYDYTSIYLMETTGRRKLFLTLSVANAMLILGFFKYSLFITGNLNLLLGIAGTSFTIPSPQTVLPVGVSFFIFLSLGNTIDFFYGRSERERDIISHAAFVSFFPSLLAGPIERGHHLLPQLKNWNRPGLPDFKEGVHLFVTGMFKKMALADYFALYADRVFGNPAQFTSGDLVAGALAFTWQIYFDFSGYTDMARGIARTLGIDLMENFNSPYMAKSTGDFWGRWHISLSSWFRDFLYIPLGGSRRGELRETRNILATMLVSGLWHGASWNFVLWGLIHGVIHTMGKFAGKLNFTGKIPLPVRRIAIFILIVFTWIFFRSESGSEAFMYIGRIFTTGFSLPGMPCFMFLLIAVSYLFQWLKEYNKTGFTDKPLVKNLSVILMLLYLLILVTSGSADFIYFQF